MPEPDRADLERVAAEVVAAVERLLREGRSGRVEVHVNPHRWGRGKPPVKTLAPLRDEE